MVPMAKGLDTIDLKRLYNNFKHFHHRLLLKSPHNEQRHNEAYGLRWNEEDMATDSDKRIRETTEKDKRG